LTLGALDDKIELNRRMNETLEGMARALFRSWFVDFDPVRAKAEGRQPAALASPRLWRLRLRGRVLRGRAVSADYAASRASAAC